MAAAAQKTVVVLINGRPVTVERGVGRVAAVLQAFYPGAGRGAGRR